MADATATLVCPKGHGPGAAGSRFCMVCGSELTAPELGPFAAVLDRFAQKTQALGHAPDAADGGPSFSAPGAPAADGPVAGNAAACSQCGGDGAGLESGEDVCAECGWLRPLYPGYQLDRSVFLWAQDGQAMSKLQKISALHAAVRFASDHVGRPWIESTFNGIRLGPRQVPQVWKQGVLAARMLGLPKMPDVYISGDSLWQTFTFGSDVSSFIVLGTAILNNFQGDELLFVLAREMGHCRAGHALWKSVDRFLNGTSAKGGPLSKGILSAISPTKLIEGAVDIPLMAWSRQADITADRAGLLAVGDEGLARRVLLAWSIKSNRLLKQVNIEEWMKQEDASGDQMTRFTEMTTSSSMYTTRRLHLLGQAAKEAGLMGWSRKIQEERKKLAPPAGAPRTGAARTANAGAALSGTGAARAAGPGAGSSGAGSPAGPAPGLRVVCTQCQAPMRIPFAVLQGRTSLNVRCSQCQHVFTLRRKAEVAPGVAPSIPTPRTEASTGPQPEKRG